MRKIDKLMSGEKLFLTDGGFETWMFFQENFHAPEFAAILLMENDDACGAMRKYFDRFLELAEAANTGFVLDTNTWRGCPKWAPKLERSAEDLLQLSATATNFAKEIQNSWEKRVSPILLNGVIGPSGDGYSPEEIPSIEVAEDLHRPQIQTLVGNGVDMISAITMTNTNEAIGVVRAAEKEQIPVVISFTVETDGRLPTGETLGEAVGSVDSKTDSAPLYYMVNCAHPEHFRETISSGKEWVHRIGGVRANASRLSHAELDEADTLDVGNPNEFGQQHRELASLLPNLLVVGGCCGTDHRHVGCVSHNLHVRAAA